MSAKLGVQPARSRSTFKRLCIITENLRVVFEHFRQLSCRVIEGRGWSDSNQPPTNLCPAGRWALSILSAVYRATRLEPGAVVCRYGVVLVRCFVR
jgi:hypothetical protein